MIRSFSKTIKYHHVRGILLRGEKRALARSQLGSVSPWSSFLLQQGPFSTATTTTTTTTTTTDNDEVTTSADENVLPDEQKSSSRNKALAEIIRGGYHALNQVALDIQNCAATRKSVFAPPDAGPSPKQRAEEHLIHTTATAHLEYLAKNGKLCVDGDPIVILKVELKDSKLAIVYWCLPFSILADETMAARDKQVLEFRMHNILVKGEGTRLLQRGVHAALRHYYPPRLRLEPAPDDLLLEAMSDILD